MISGLSLLNDHAIWVCPGPEWGHDPNITMGKIMTNPWILGYPDPEIGYAVSPKYDHLNEVLMLKKKNCLSPTMRFHHLRPLPKTVKNPAILLFQKLQGPCQSLVFGVPTREVQCFVPTSIAPCLSFLDDVGDSTAISLPRDVWSQVRLPPLDSHS